MFFLLESYGVTRVLHVPTLPVPTRRPTELCAPRRQHVEPLLLLAQLARVRMMHVEAIGAAVDLRRADLDQLEQIGLDPGLFDLLREREPGLHQLRRGLVGVGTWSSYVSCRWVSQA